MPDKLGKPLADPIFDRVAILGVGLIGSSIARALRRVGVARSIALADLSESVIERARRLGLGDEYFGSAAKAVAGAGLVIFCVPVGANASLAAEIGSVLMQGAVVSDVGSVKGAVVAAIAPHLPRHAQLVPAHPVAGTEQSGPDAGFATLFSIDGAS